MIKRYLVIAITLVCAVAYSQEWVDQINVDNIRLDGNTISTLDTNGNLLLTPNGTGKVRFSSATATTVPYMDANKDLVSSAVTPTELGYLTGVTSAIQTQLNAAATDTDLSDHVADTTTHGTTGAIVGISDSQVLTNKSIDADANTLTNIENADIKAAAAIAVNKLAAVTTGRVLISDGSGFISVGTTTATEINYVNGVTSAIQTQINTKAPSASPTFTGTVTGPFTTAGPVITTSGGVLSSEAALAIARGGTNNASLAVTAGGALYTDGSKVANIGAGSTGQVLMSQGASAPIWTAAPGGGTNDQSEYITNGKFDSATTGWAAYADAAATTPVDCTGGSPASTFARDTAMDTSGNGLWTKSAANRQGEGYSYDFVIEKRTGTNLRPVILSFPYRTGANFASNDMTVHVYDKDGAVLLPTQTIQSTTAGSILASTSGTTWTGAFYPTATSSVNYRLCVHTATTNATAYNFEIDSVHAGNQVTTPGAINEYLGALTTTGTWTSGATYAGKYWREGDFLRGQVVITASGAVTATGLNLTLPSSLTIDTAKLGQSTSAMKIEGGWRCDNPADNVYEGTMAYSSTTAVSTWRPITKDGNAFSELYFGNQLTNAAPFTIGASDTCSIWYRVPITGWSTSAALSTSEILLSAGRMRASGNPASAAGDAPIIFPTRDYDNFSTYSVSTGLYTVLKTGYYRVHGFIVSATATSSIKIFVDSSVVVFAANTDSNGEAAYTGTVFARAGQTISVRPSGTLDVDNLSTLHIEELPDFSIFAQYNSDRWYVNANISGANPSLGIAAVTAYTEIIDAGLTMTPVSGSAPVAVMCSTTNAATAPTTSTSVCAAGSESVGANFYIPEPGIYEVCAQGSWIGSGDTAEAVNAAFEIIETPLTAQTLSLEGNVRTQVGLSAMTIASGVDQATIQIVNNCALFNWSNVAAGTNKGVRLMYEQSVIGTPDTSALLMDANTSNGQRDFNIRVRKF